MNLRRYTALAPSRGTVIPDAIRRAVIFRDHGCVGPRVGMSTYCYGNVELDHVRASHAMAMKSETSERNLVSLCNRHHLERTLNGRKWRPLLLDYLQG